MKKCTIIICIFVLFLTGCANDQNNLSIYSVSDEKLFISIGENKEIVDERLGNPKEIKDGICTYLVGDSELEACYDNNNNVCIISCRNSNFELNSGIKVGYNMNSVYQVYDQSKLDNKTVYISNKNNEGKIISKNEIDINDTSDIYIISFGSSVSSGVVDSIMIGNYKSMLFSEYNHEIK